jgi:Leucine-rich repeat (LRR) protein
LREIYLCGNKFKEFPKQLLFVASIQKIDLCHNEISMIPSEIVELKNLKVLELTGNPIDFSEIVKLRKLMPKTKIKFKKRKKHSR